MGYPAFQNERHERVSPPPRPSPWDRRYWSSEYRPLHFAKITFAVASCTAASPHTAPSLRPATDVTHPLNTNEKKNASMNAVRMVTVFAQTLGT